MLKPKKISGVLEQDSAILPMFGFKVNSIRQVMCRPTDNQTLELPNDFVCRKIDPDADMEEIGRTIMAGYAGGVDYVTYGEATLEESIEDAKHVLKIYSPRNFSHVITSKVNNRIVRVCLAGVGENYTLGYAEIADICVLPQFQGRGLAKYMIARTVSEACDIAPFVKLCVTIGNPAENLYHTMGFFAGPRFANMSLRT